MAVVTRSQTAALHREADLQTPLVSDSERDPTEAESEPVDKPAEADLAFLFENSDVTDTIPFELVDRTELIRLQQSDTSLSSLFQLAEKGDDHYFLKSGVLLRSWLPPRSKKWPHQRVVSIR